MPDDVERKCIRQVLSKYFSLNFLFRVLYFRLYGTRKSYHRSGSMQSSPARPLREEGSLSLSQLRASHWWHMLPKVPVQFVARMISVITRQ
ncbi:unnamed protein product, partial [Choristocarpus tenellus]